MIDNLFRGICFGESMTEMTDTSADQPEMRGTPITRSGGYAIRVGWGAKAYSVDRATEGRYRRAKFLLLVLAIAVGVGVSFLGEFLLFEVVGPLVRSYTPLIAHCPEIWLFVIYGLTFVFGTAIYWQIVSKVGHGMVKQQKPLDDGYSLIEQRQRWAKKRKRDLIPLAIGIAAVTYNPSEFGFGLQAFLLILFGFLFFEGLFFKYIKPVKEAKKRF